MTRRVVVFTYDGISPFHLAVPCLVFGERFGGAVPARYDVVVAAEKPGRVRTSMGYDVVVDHGLASFSSADMIVFPSADVAVPVAPAVLAALAIAHAAGARVVGLCRGAFVLAAAGLLEGREAVTHWADTAELARRHPGVTVRPDVLWSDHGDVLTSAGAAASLDCCLHVVRRDHGVETATALARYLVMAPNREGNQAQYLSMPVVSGGDDDPIERAMVWARGRLDEEIALDRWAREVAMSRRTFTRRFRQRTGRSCHDWLVGQRLDLARLLLETTNHPVDRVAARSGFGTSAVLRHHFRRRLDTTPAQHRRAFSTVARPDRVSAGMWTTPA